MQAARLPLRGGIREVAGGAINEVGFLSMGNPALDARRYAARKAAGLSRGNPMPHLFRFALSRRWWPKSLVIVCATVLSLVAEGRDQVKKIQIENSQNGVVFEFLNCRKSSYVGPVKLQDILVYQAGRLDEICRRSSLTGESTEVKRWTYGTKLAGFSESNCPTLRSGIKYSIVAMGSGEHYSASQRRFSLDERGRLKLGVESC